LNCTGRRRQRGKEGGQIKTGPNPQHKNKWGGSEDKNRKSAAKVGVVQEVQEANGSTKVGGVVDNKGRPIEQALKGGGDGRATQENPNKKRTEPREKGGKRLN